MGESGVDAFTIKKIAGHGSIKTSEGYVHPTPEHLERAFQRFQGHGVTTVFTTVETGENTKVATEVAASVVQ